MSALALATTGCSSLRLGYNQAPNLVYWWLDGYVDFDDAQEPKAREALADWFAWHRRTQLPDYSALLTRIETEALQDTTPERACEWWTELSRRVEVLSDRAVPAAAELLPTLSAEQIGQVEKRYQKANAEYRSDYLQSDPARRQKEAVKRAVDRAENLYGRLDEAQRARIARMTAESPFDPELALAERQRRQQEALQMLRRLVAENPGSERTQAALRSYFDSLRRSPREEYRRYVDRWTQYNCGFTASLHNSTTAAQRQTALQKLKGWQGDLRALAADGS